MVICITIWLILLHTVIRTQTAMARLRNLARWIDRTPQRKQKWNEVCIGRLGEELAAII
ncbi:hypothetical protein V1527DRAFT_472009 [Lipomyces starkeyi]